MENKLYVCEKCGKNLEEKDTCFHAIRGGYSAAHFPLFHFDRVPLCFECRERQKKIDRFEKVLAILTLGVVLYFMIMGMIFLFGLRG